ncbi:sulfite exporter TauE/SafE family protein [Marinicella sp. W31]|uniref:sulfite exporter TauE/SafE family protein n=1 Tax=Marinicella sp. W31 TaxID=3023713 RepID=UPI003756FD4F
MWNELAPLVSACVLGLVGSGHCLGMCGGITVALNASAAEEKRLRLSTVYQVFRVVSYALLGAVVGGLGHVFERWTQLPLLPVIGAVLLLMLGLYLMRFWNVLVYLEKVGWRLWSHIAPIQKRFIPVKSYTQAMVVGLLWGLLPCGLVYSALALAASSGDIYMGAATMAAFGLGTMPMMLATGLFSRQLLMTFRKPRVQMLMGIVFVVWGAWQLYSVLGESGHHHHEMPHQTGTLTHIHSE